MDQGRKKMKNRSILIVILISLLLGGCVSITKELPAFNTYTLQLDDVKKSDSKIDYSITISEPKSLSSINTKFITYTMGYRYENYSLSKWSDSPSKMLQKNITSYLSLRDNYKYINSSKVNIKSDYKLVSELENFTQVFTKDGVFVKVDIRVYLKGKRSEIYVKSFSYTKKSTSDNAIGAVESFNILTNEFVRDLDVWIIQTLEKVS